MALAFRNVNAGVGDAVDSWPQEALLAALERGSIGDWRRIVRVIEVDPWGPVSRGIEEVLTYSRPYGVDVLMDMALANARAAADKRDREEAAARVREAFHRSGMSVADFAARIGTSRSRMSTYLSGKVTPSAALLIRMER